MALGTNELYSQSQQNYQPRMQPATGPGAVRTAIFATGTAGLKLLPGCPVFIDAATGYVKLLVPGSATAQEKQIAGFVYLEPVTLSASTETLGNIMVRGMIPYEEVLQMKNAVDAAKPGVALAGTVQQLIDCLRDPLLMERGLYIENLTRLGATAGVANP